MDSRHDVVIAGGGHNALVAAAYLARAGRSVLVLERREHVGGAAVSERPFAGVDARLSRYAYLVSLLPRQIVDELGLRVELERRAFSAWAPGVLIGPDPTPGWTRLYETCARVARVVAPSLLEPLRPEAELRAAAGEAAWDALVRRPIGELIEEHLDDDTLRGIALTDGLIGTFAGAHDPDRRQNRCFLYHVLAPWDVPVGGMGAVSSAIEDAARAAGAEIRCGVEVTGVEPGAVHHSDGVARATHVLIGFETDTHDEGAQLKVNFLLKRLPRLKDGTDPRAAFAGTAHINEGYAQLATAHQQAAAGKLPDVVPCEVYCHSLTDPSILGPELRAAGAQTLTCFALHMPARLFPNGHALDATLASLNSVLAEPIEDCLWRDADGRPCIEARTPLDLEAELGMPGGNIFHRDLRWPFAETPEEAGTWGVETDHPAIFRCGAGARRGGGVSGVPGRNAAMAVLSA